MAREPQKESEETWAWDFRAQARFHGEHSSHNASSHDLAVRPQTSLQWSLYLQATITTMTTELRTLQVQFEEAISTHQREAETLREKLREIAAERSSVRREVRRWAS